MFNEVALGEPGRGGAEEVGDSVETIVRFYLHLVKCDTGRKSGTAFDKQAVAAGF